MHGSEAGSIVRTESRRWGRDTTAGIAGGTAVVLSAGLTFLAVSVAAAGGTDTGTGGVQLETDGALTSASSSADLASLAQSAVTMLVPLVAVVIGAHFAGAEMTSGALLHVAVAARRLRVVFAVRAVSLAVIAGAVGALTALAAIGAADVGVRAAGLLHLTAGTATGRTVAGAAASAAVIALLTFALACLTRRSVIVLVVMLAYLVVIEPVIAGTIPDGAVWLPRSALTALVRTDAEPLHALPVLLAALGLVCIAVARCRRDRAA
ncbi:hypothetical protein AAEP80_09830 [Curtobacterium sp. L3-7]|uniref:hypothetical protein n=1 Tax=Curtobacterium sp. L3-7 TaxID=3138787 RepID=UPI003B5189F0